MGGGGGGEGQDRRLHGVAAPSDLPVRRAEVVPPLADAVGLVHRQEPDALRAQALHEAGEVEPLRRHEEDVQPPVPGPGGRLPPLGGLLPGAEEGGAEPGVGGAAHLVLHEGHQGGDDQREPPQGQRRDLVADALATAGGEDAQGVAAGEDGPHQLLLARAERRVPQVLAEEEPGVGKGGRVHAPGWGDAGGGDMAGWGLPGGRRGIRVARRVVILGLVVLVVLLPPTPPPRQHGKEPAGPKDDDGRAGEP